MMDKQNCYGCPHFKIISEPIRAKGGGYWDFGRAECIKHELIVDFATHRKLKKLKCVEDENQNAEGK